MSSTKKTSLVIGILFLTAMVSSLLGGGFIETIISTPDYLSTLSENSILLNAGVYLEIVNGVAVIVIAVLMFSIMKTYSDKMAAGYLSFRILESMFCLLSAMIPLLLISLHKEMLTIKIADFTKYETLSSVIVSLRTETSGLMIPITFGIGALIFYTFLYKFKLLPRYISVWGFVGAVLIILMNIVKFENTVAMILALPIITNEIFLGIWLIVKGFDEKSVTPESMTSLANEA